MPPRRRGLGKLLGVLPCSPFGAASTATVKQPAGSTRTPPSLAVASQRSIHDCGVAGAGVVAHTAHHLTAPHVRTVRLIGAPRVHHTCEAAVAACGMANIKGSPRVNNKFLCLSSFPSKQPDPAASRPRRSSLPAPPLPRHRVATTHTALNDILTLLAWYWRLSVLLGESNKPPSLHLQTRKSSHRAGSQYQPRKSDTITSCI